MTHAGNKFPTRQFPYRKAQDGVVGLESANPVPSQALNPNTIYRFVLGLDVQPKVMTSEEAQQSLQDPFGGKLLIRGRFPLTLRSLLAEFSQPDSSLPMQQSFVVADGGQIHWNDSTESVDRNIRFAISRSNSNGDSVLISTGTQFDSVAIFLQVLAWDSVNEVFNYYERRAGTWIWAGNSYHALDDSSRGKGPFDSHVNGSLVMKELKLPWTHWHSQASAITDDVLSPDDPLRSEPLWQAKSGAEDFETSVVRPGIRKWTASRVAKAIGSSANGQLANLPQLLRHLFETTTVNLVASDSQSRSIVQNTQVKLPLSFFVNSDILFDVLEVEPNIEVPVVSGEFYLRNLEAFDFRLRTNGFDRTGDTHFAFVVPEPSFEDNQVVNEVLRRSLVSPRFVACVMMVDFANPVSSVQRNALHKYVPANVQVLDGSSDFVSQFVANVETAIANSEDASADGSPEQQFMSHWQLDDSWKSNFEQRIENYFAAIKQRLQSQSGYDDFVRLAESRRREFRRRPLAEFELTLPITNIPNDAPLLQMLEDGSVGPK